MTEILNKIKIIINILWFIFLLLFVNFDKVMTFLTAFTLDEFITYSDTSMSLCYWSLKMYVRKSLIHNKEPFKDYLSWPLPLPQIWNCDSICDTYLYTFDCVPWTIHSIEICMRFMIKTWMMTWWDCLSRFLVSR